MNFLKQNGMLVQLLFLFLGLALLIKGADWMVNGASALARKYNISDLAIGLTVVAFGTSAPEMVVNVYASLQGHHEIVFGNVIGSNNFNLFVILGISGIITPIAVQSSTVWKEIPISLGIVVVLFVLTNELIIPGTNILSRLDGLILLVLFAGFLYYVYSQLKSDPQTEGHSVVSYSQLKIWVLIIVGLAGLVAGGQLVVTNAVKMAQMMGVSEKMIALTIVSAGTSLPELATSVVAAVKKNNDIAVGNIVGSNIFNLLLILPMSSFAKPILYDLKFNTDMYLLAGGTLFVFVAMFTGGKKKLDRWEAALLLACFIAYTVLLISKEV
jgi:cation:H+ antiporter